MQTFQFLLITYWLDSPDFLKEVARDDVKTVSLCGNLQNIFLTHSPTSHLRHFTNTFCVTPLALHTRHLSCVSRDRRMFAAADFKPSDVRFNARWST